MRTRTKYTAKEASDVMRLLRHRLSARRDIQKADRDELRTKYGFWISEFGRGFSDRDFRDKVDAGRFRIVK
jgi:hypothetical protein